MFHFNLFRSYRNYDDNWILQAFYLEESAQLVWNWTYSSAYITYLQASDGLGEVCVKLCRSFSKTYLWFKAAKLWL